jgi:hypothetical protein
MAGNRRYDAKRDLSEPDIIKALRRADYQVYQSLEVDLLVRHPSWEPGMLLAIEVKTPDPITGKLPVRSDRKAQQAFIEETGCPVVGTPESALQAVTRDSALQRSKEGM